MSTRRTFIAGLGAAGAWPLAVRAQQVEQMRRIGVLMSSVERPADRRFRSSEFSPRQDGRG